MPFLSATKSSSSVGHAYKYPLVGEYVRGIGTNSIWIITVEICIHCLAELEHLERVSAKDKLAVGEHTILHKSLFTALYVPLS